MSAVMEVYHRLRQTILEGGVTEAEALAENSVASRFGVSRTPVREALRRLEADGLVEREGQQFYVRSRRPDEIIQIYEARILLEGAASRAAAERHTVVDLSRLRSVVAEEQRVGTEDPSQRVVLNQRFHQAVWAASHHATFTDLLERLSVHLVRYPTTTLNYRDRWQEAIGEHERLVAAIAARDGYAADEIARDHMGKARDIRLAMWQEEPPGAWIGMTDPS